MIFSLASLLVYFLSFALNLINIPTATELNCRKVPTKIPHQISNMAEQKIVKCLCFYFCQNVLLSPPQPTPHQDYYNPATIYRIKNQDYKQQAPVEAQVFTIFFFKRKALRIYRSIWLIFYFSNRNYNNWCSSTFLHRIYN